jgi:dUTP pyrophosphatase
MALSLAYVYDVTEDNNMIANIKFAKVHPDAQIPTKRDEDAGWDLYPCFEESWIKIPPNESRLVPLGIASALEHGWAFVFRERGSTGAQNIKVSAGVIDEGFNGPWFACIYNGNSVPLFISKIGETGEQSPLIECPNAILYPYHKAIAQALLVQVPEVKVDEVEYDEIMTRKTERGLGQLGSTNISTKNV